MKYNEIFWGDSIFDGMHIEYNCITVDVYNDVLQRKISIICSGCIGTSEIFVWDEVIIENIFLDPVDERDLPMLQKADKLYGNGIFDSNRELLQPLCKLRVLLINGAEFCIICRTVEFVE